MTWSSMPLKAGLLAAAFALAGSAALAAPTPDRPRDCFFTHEWRGWSAPNGDTLYLRVGLRDVYRVDLTPGSRVSRRSGSQHLINHVHGSDTICSHLDLDLALSDTIGIRRPLIARSIVKLTPEEVAAIPKKDLP